MGITLFIGLAMLFFLYVEVRIVMSKNISLLEKLASAVAFLMIETYYILQLIERF